MRWTDIISESLATPFPIKWEQRSEKRWYGTFLAGEEEYFVECYRIDGFSHPDDVKSSHRKADWYDMAFSLTQDGLAGDRVIGTGGMQFRIFATVIAGIREFINAVRPEFIMLSASKDNENRLPLYQRMAIRFGDELRSFGYEPTEAPEHHYADVRAIADTLAWRRREKISESLSDYTRKLLDSIPETGSIKVNLDGSVMNSIRALEAEGLITAKINASTFQALLSRKAKPITSTEHNGISISMLPAATKADILDMCLGPNGPKALETFWMDRYGIMSFNETYMSQFLFGDEDLTRTDYGGVVNVEMISLDPHQLDNARRSVSDLVVNQYTKLRTSAPPILVRKDGQKWKLVEGGHRLAAAKARGDKTINAVDVTIFFSLSVEGWENFD